MAASGTGGAVRDAAFDWPEAVPQEGTCEPGKYEGTFTCNVSPFPGAPAFQVTGPIVFELERSVNGEFLEIKDGRMDALAVIAFPFGAGLEGKLDCNTREFVADTKDGTYIIPLGVGQFFGTLNGTLDGLENTLTGTWHLTGGTEEMPQSISCQGDWSAVKK